MMRDDDDEKFSIPKYSKFYMTKSGHVYRINKNNRLPLYEKRKLTKVKYGYSVGVVCDDGKSKTFTVHKLMAMTFKNIDDKKYRILHIDGNVYNNHLDNIQIVPLITVGNNICTCNCHKKAIPSD